MKATRTVTVTILGKEYQVACGAEEQDALIRAARQLDERMRIIRQSGNVIGLERIAVMAALNLSHELLQANEQTAISEQLLARMTNKLEAAMTKTDLFEPDR